MKTKKFNKLGKRKYSIIFLVAGAVIITAFGAWKFFGPSTDKLEPDGTPTTQVSEIGAEDVVVLVAAKNLVVGDTITADSYEKVVMNKNMVPLDSATDQIDISKKMVKTPINEGEPILKTNLMDALASTKADGKLTEYTFIGGTIPTVISREQLVGSLVDIVLLRQGQVDAVVLAKETVVAQSESNLGFHLTFEEDERLREAGFEGQFYFRIYLDPSQEASTVTYTPVYDGDIDGLAISPIDIDQIKNAVDANNKEVEVDAVD